MSDDNTAAVAALAESVSPRGNNNLADIMFDLSVNFLLYVVLIIVFYMLVRFYLEEDTSISHATSEGYSLVSTEDDDEAKVGDDEQYLPLHLALDCAQPNPQLSAMLLEQYPEAAFQKS
eukprot:gene24575-30434_t